MDISENATLSAVAFFAGKAASIGNVNRTVTDITRNAQNLSSWCVLHSVCTFMCHHHTHHFCAMSTEHSCWHDCVPSVTSSHRPYVCKSPAARRHCLLITSYSYDSKTMRELCVSPTCASLACRELRSRRNTNASLDKSEWTQLRHPVQILSANR
jgi:hypothetical protein